MQWSFAAITEADIDQLLEIERCSFKRPWSRLSFSNELIIKDAGAYAAKNERVTGYDRILGYICSRLVINEMHILKIAVAPRWQGQGIASWMFQKSVELALEKGSKQAFLEVRPSNISAINFYNKIGFQIIGKRKNYYIETQEDALVMAKNLEETL